MSLHRLDDPSAMARYRQSALVGTGASGGAELGPLAWLAARERFARAPVPELGPTAPWPQETRAIVPAAARAPLRALLTGRDARADGPYARRLSHELRRHGLRLHPYDLKPLESFVSRHAARLGRHAQAWLAIARPVQSEIREPYAEEVEALSEATFAAAGRAEKLAFLRRARGEDAAAARAFIEQRLAAENAAVRAGFVAVLEVGLGADDAALLESLADDRAPSVREAAAAMLARVPGTEAYATRKREAAAWLEIKTGGMLRRTRTLAVRRPGTLPDGRVDAALTAAFEGVSLADMAAPFDMPLAEFAAAARGDWRVGHLVLTRAVREDRPDLVAIMTQPDEAGDVGLAVLAAALSALPVARRTAIVEAGVHPARWTSLPRQTVEALQEALEGPLPDAVATALLRSAVWAKTIERWVADDDRAAPDIIEAVAGLLPLSHADFFLAGLEPLAAGLKRRPRLFFDCLKTFASSPGAAS